MFILSQEILSSISFHGKQRTTDGLPEIGTPARCTAHARGRRAATTDDDRDICTGGGLPQARRPLSHAETE